jgi:hypothetical protein
VSGTGVPQSVASPREDYLMETNPATIFLVIIFIFGALGILGKFLE